MSDVVSVFEALNHMAYQSFCALGGRVYCYEVEGAFA